jgi:hypothetical protein
VGGPSARSRQPRTAVMVSLAMVCAGGLVLIAGAPIWAGQGAGATGVNARCASRNGPVYPSPLLIRLFAHRVVGWCTHRRSGKRQFTHLVMDRCTRTHSPHPPPWPGHSFPYTLAASSFVARH